MSYPDERIDYTNYLRDKPQETDPEKLAVMKEALVKVLRARGVHGHISAVYYTNGCVKVSVNGEYYNVVNTNTGGASRGTPETHSERKRPPQVRPTLAGAAVENKYPERFPPPF